MKVDSREGCLACQLNAHHDHARHPEEDDVVPGFQRVGGVEALQVRGILIGPSQGREGPEP